VLYKAEAAPGFIGALLDIVETDSDQSIRLSGMRNFFYKLSSCMPVCFETVLYNFEYLCCDIYLTFTMLLLAIIFLKNRVIRAWENSLDIKVTVIPESEKGPFRERLIPVLAHQSTKIRQQLIPMIGKILHYDFPEKWPSYMDITIRLLNENDIQSVFAGLQCLLSICRVYRFKSAVEKKEELEKVIQATFPQILNIGNKLAEQNDTESGEMLRIIFKTYKHAIYVSALCEKKLWN